MSIKVRLFGELRDHAPVGTRTGEPVEVHLTADQTLGELLVWLGIEYRKVGNVFINGCLLPRAMYPITLGFRRVAERPLAAEEYLALPVKPGDRVGIFPRNMSSVVV
jgi:hypothetical protein